MSVTMPYTMSGVKESSSEAPYQVQMFVSLEDPPACQDYRTYKEAAKRVSELLLDPVCPITGKALINITLAKWFEPDILIEVKIKEEEGIKVDYLPGVGVETQTQEG